MADLSGVNAHRRSLPQNTHIKELGLAPAMRFSKVKCGSSLGRSVNSLSDAGFKRLVQRISFELRCPSLNCSC